MCWSSSVEGTLPTYAFGAPLFGGKLETVARRKANGDTKFKEKRREKTRIVCLEHENQKKKT